MGFDEWPSFVDQLHLPSPIARQSVAFPTRSPVGEDERSGRKTHNVGGARVQNDGGHGTRVSWLDA